MRPIEFVFKLKKIDDKQLSCRDVMAIYVVLTHPGIASKDLTNKLGYRRHSSMQKSIYRLIKDGYVVDHRERAVQAVPRCLHITDKGREFWNWLISD